MSVIGVAPAMRDNLHGHLVRPSAGAAAAHVDSHSRAGNGQTQSTREQGRATRIEDQLLRQSVTAIDALELEPHLIGTVITSSLYSLGCPTLAHRLVEHYGMDPATDKYHVTGVGCASGVPLMRLAAQAMAEHPGRQALVVAAESMSGTITRARPGDSRAKIVASAIFGDGC